MTPAGTPDIDIARWIACEREALSGPDGPQFGAIPAGRWVARTVREQLAGEDGIASHLDDIHVRTDADTPRVADIQRQADIIEHEVRKAAQIGGFDPTAPHVLVTTAKRITTQWLTLGRRLAEMDRGSRASPAILIHVPRKRLDQSTYAAVHTRSSAALVDEWVAWEHRIVRILHGETPAMARPGDHCRRCTLDCGVRA